MIYALMKNVSVFVIHKFNKDRILPENRDVGYECQACKKIVPISKLEQHVMKEYFWN